MPDKLVVDGLPSALANVEIANRCGMTLKTARCCKCACTCTTASQTNCRSSTYLAATTATAWPACQHKGMARQERAAKAPLAGGWTATTVIAEEPLLMGTTDRQGIFVGPSLPRLGRSWPPPPQATAILRWFYLPLWLWCSLIPILRRKRLAESLDQELKVARFVSRDRLAPLIHTTPPFLPIWNSSCCLEEPGN